MTSSTGVVEFRTGFPASHNLISDVNGYDIEILPNGNLLVATNYELVEMTPDGTNVREIHLSDPYNNGAGALTWFSAIRGIAYDPVEDVIFVTHIGNSNFSFRLMKIEAQTGYLLKHESAQNGQDLFLNSDGILAVAFGYQDVGLYSTDLEYLGSFSGGSSRFFLTHHDFALAEDISPHRFTVDQGVLLSGSADNLTASDNSYLTGS